MAAAHQEALLATLAAGASDSEWLSAAERAALGYATVLTQAPWEVSAHHIEALRFEGFDDRAIHDLCAIVAYFAFVNRIADGLGVELEGLPDSPTTDRSSRALDG